MILIRLMGGLGNQMFQYAFGKALSVKYNTELVLDKTLLLDKTSPHEVNTHRDFELDIFKKLTFRWATGKEVFLFNGLPNASLYSRITRKIRNTINRKQLIIQHHNDIAADYFVVNGDTCFVGRWQSYQFFESYEKEIITSFEMEKPDIDQIDEVLNSIKGVNSVCLHIRRGDLITSSLYSTTIGALDLSYYRRAVNEVVGKIQNPVFFIFSDDIVWCKQNIQLEFPVVFIEEKLAGNKAEGHFYLMRECQHFIISNSTFAWWSAFLSKNLNKQVVYPSDWYKKELLANPNMCPESWVAL